MKHSLLSSLGAAFLLSAGIANAQTPPEVLKPYKAYQNAVNAGDGVSAIKHARSAWKKAETHLGKSKTTGDLALIYARAAESSDVEAAIKAYQRAIELSPERNQADAIAKVERYVDLVQALAKTRKITRARKPVKQAEALMQTHDLIGSTFDGEIKTLSGLVSYAQQRNGEALEKYNAAIEIFESDGHKHSSIFPYTVRVYKGNLLGKKDAINAALEYQVVMQNLEGKLDKDHPLIRTAFNGWVHNMA